MMSTDSRDRGLNDIKTIHKVRNGFIGAPPILRRPTRAGKQKERNSAPKAPRFRSVMSLLVSRIPTRLPHSSCRPPARHTHQGSVSFRMDELPLQWPVLSNSHDLVKWRGKNRPQEFVSDMAERFVLVPTVQLLGAAVPERYHLIHAAYEDRVAREVEELIPPTMRGLAGLPLLFAVPRPGLHSGFDRAQASRSGAA